MATPSHLPWGSIELLHNAVRTLNYLHTLGQPLPRLRYRAKVKLHGTNVGVQITDDGVFAQSRTQLLSPADDLKGFAAFVAERAELFAALPRDLTLFGEWAGPGVEKGMAVSGLPHKVFAVFALQWGRGEEARVEVEPERIRAVLPERPELRVLPWEPAYAVDIDYGDPAQLGMAAERINGFVAEVEAEDPWVKRTFGLSGVGEGLVYYPEGEQPGERLFQLMFKAKGDKHRTAGLKPAQASATVAAGVPDFVALMLTEARLEQGVRDGCGGLAEPRKMGEFLRWIAADLEKESVAELEVSGLSWPQVAKAVQQRAREWFLVRCR